MKSNRKKNLSDSVVCMSKYRGVNVVWLLEFWKTPAIFWQHMKRCVRFMDPKIDKERLARLFAEFDELNRAPCVIMNGQLLAGTIECTIFVVAIDTG